VRTGGGAKPAEKEEVAPQTKDSVKGTKGKGKGKGKGHQEKMSFVDALMARHAPKTTQPQQVEAMEVESPAGSPVESQGKEKKEKEEQAAKKTELTAIIKQFENMPSGPTRDSMLEQARQQLRELEPQPTPTQAADLVTVTRMKADFLRDSENLNKKMESRLEHARTRMEAAQKEHEQLVQEQTKMLEEQAIEKAKLTAAIQLLENKCTAETGGSLPGGQDQSAQQNALEAASRVDPAQLTTIMEENLKVLEPSQKMLALGVSKEAVMEILQLGASQIVQNQILERTKLDKEKEDKANAAAALAAGIAAAAQPVPTEPAQNTNSVA